MKKNKIIYVPVRTCEINLNTVRVLCSSETGSIDNMTVEDVINGNEDFD